MPLCRRLARIDSPRARRVAAAQQGPAERAIAWAYVALGLAEKDKAGAGEAVDRAIAEIDRLRESGPGPEPIPILGDVRLMYPTNPAALILPVVERAVPDRLGDIFWRTSRFIPGLKRARTISSVTRASVSSARFWRDMTARWPPHSSRRWMLTYALAVRKGPRNEFAASHLVAKGCIDPRAAIAHSGIPDHSGTFQSATRGFQSIESGLYSADHTCQGLGQPREDRWKYLWSRLGMHLRSTIDLNARHAWAFQAARSGFAAQRRSICSLNW